MKVRDQIEGSKRLGSTPSRSSLRRASTPQRLQGSRCSGRRDRFIDHGGARRHDHHRAQARPLPLLAARRGEPLVSLYRSAKAASLL